MACFGRDYMRCPSSLKQVANDNYSYGLNYPFVFGYTPDLPYLQQGGPKLHNLPSQVFLVADARDTLWGGMPAIYYPSNNVYGSLWNLTVDLDQDGIPDTYNAAYPYNGFRPIHSGGGNFLFGDSRVEWVSIRNWATDKNGLWGANNFSAYR